MARTRSPDREKAWKLYKRFDGNIKNQKIAEILGADPKTISKWKTLDEWDKKLGKRKDTKTEKTNEVKTEDVQNGMEEIEEWEGLTDKQILFCIEYISCFNATKAYQRAYGANRKFSATAGSRMIKNDNVLKAIEKLKKSKIDQKLIESEDIFQRYMDIAFCDMKEYVEWGSDNGTTFMRIRNSEDVDGTLVTAVKDGRNGLEIKTISGSDRLRALDWLADHMGMATAEQKAKVESLKSKVKVEQERLKMAKEAQEANNW